RSYHQTGIDGYPNTISFFSFLGGYHNNPVGSPGSVKSTCGSTFQNVDGFYIVRVNIRSCIPIIIPSTTSLLIRCVGVIVVNRNPIHNKQGLVISGNRGITPDNRICRSAHSTGRLDLQSGHLTGKGVNKVGLLYLGDLVP